MTPDPITKPLVSGCGSPDEHVGRRHPTDAGTLEGFPASGVASGGATGTSTRQPGNDSLVILVDSREQAPLVFGPGVAVEVVGLPEGDYSARGLEGIAAIERKSLSDLIGSLTFERERFEAEIERLASYAFRCVVVEGDLDDLIEWRYRSRANPSSIVGSIASMMAKGTPFIFAGNARNAAIVVERLLRKLLKHHGQAAHDVHETPAGRWTRIGAEEHHA